jgi:arsenate reductase
MAEGLAKSMLGKNHNIQSAGSMPSGEVHPHAVKAMDDIGIDIRDQYSKSVDDLDIQFVDNLDYVITLCSDEICPSILIKSKKLHWINEDPGRTGISELEQTILFNKVRDNLYKLIKKFLIMN